MNWLKTIIIKTWPFLIGSLIGTILAIIFFLGVFPLKTTLIISLTFGIGVSAFGMVVARVIG